jgi:hypothetical protein
MDVMMCMHHTVGAGFGFQPSWRINNQGWTWWSVGHMM